MTIESTTPEHSTESDSDALNAPAGTPGPDGEESAAESSTERAPKYRERLKLAEQTRDKYKAAFEPFARSACEQAVGSRLADPSALWLLPELAADPLALLDDETLAVDQAKIDAAVERLLSRAPSLGRRSPGSADGGARGAPDRSSASWADVLKK